MHERKFISIKHTCPYSYATLGTFFSATRYMPSKMSNWCLHKFHKWVWPWPWTFNAVHFLQVKNLRWRQKWIVTIPLSVLMMMSLLLVCLLFDTLQLGMNIIHLSICLSVCNGCIVAKRCQIEPRLLLIIIGSHIIDLGWPWKVTMHCGMLIVWYCG